MTTLQQRLQDAEPVQAVTLCAAAAEGVPEPSTAGQVRLLLQVQLSDQDALPARLPHKLNASMPAAGR